MELNFEQLLQIPGCRFEYHGHSDLLKKPVANLSIDSRTLQPRDIYLALKGETHDGHAFVDAAFERHAAAAILDADFFASAADSVKQRNVFVVKDTLLALQELSKFYRQRFQIPFIALTGTNGKTTTKEMIAAVLGQSGSVCKTQGNFNNHIGLPLTLLELQRKHDFAVIEMGTNHFGEISRLCQIAEPDLGLITNVGHGHTEYLLDLQGVAKAKMELFDYLQPGKLVLLNLDDPELARRADAVNRKVSYSLTMKADITGERLSLDAAGHPGLRVDGIDIRLNLVGWHNVQNAVAAIATGIQFGIAVSSMKEALENIELPSKRMQISKVAGVTILNDCYNANPESTKAALQTMAEIPVSGRKIVVLGDMLELGPSGGEIHTEIGNAVAQHGADALLGFGPLTRLAVSAFASRAKTRPGHNFDDKNKLVEALNELVEPGDIVLVKGSRGMKMEEIIDGLRPTG